MRGWNTTLFTVLVLTSWIRDRLSIADGAKLMMM